MQLQQDYHRKLSESVLAWWRDAGVDFAVEGESMNWLAPVEQKPIAQMPVTEKSPRVEPLRAIIPETANLQKAAPVSSPSTWPTDLASLKTAISQGALPGCSYGSRCIVPLGECGATAMVLSDIPEEDEISTGEFGKGQGSALLKNMLLSAEILPDLTYCTALAHSRPATGTLPKADLPALAAFARHQVELVKPKVLVLFGSAACEAILSLELMQARGILHYINHDDRKTAAIVTFHPRTLLAQPQLKAQAWKDLQMLARKVYL